MRETDTIQTRCIDTYSHKDKVVQGSTIPAGGRNFEIYHESPKV